MKNTIIIPVIIGTILIAAFAIYAINQPKNVSNPTISTSTSKANQTKNIKLGLVATLSGEAISYGQTMLAASKLAVADFQKQNPNTAVELIPEDEKCEASSALSAVSKLQSVDNVDAIIGFVCSKAALPAIKQIKDLPVVVSCASSPELTKVGVNIFRSAISDAVQAPNQAKMINSLGGQKAAVIYGNEVFGQGSAKAFEAELSKTNTKLALSQSIEQTDSNYAGLIQKIKDSGANYLYLATLPSYGTNLLKAIRQSDLKIKIVSETIAIDGDSVKSGLAEGLFAGLPKTQPTQALLDVISKTGYDTSLCDQYTYDATMAILQSLNQPGSAIDNLARVNFVGQGGQVKFDQNREIEKINYSTKQIVNGKMVDFK
jgi:branched-chain amino acid transport system substrate-binding protein